MSICAQTQEQGARLLEPKGGVGGSQRRGEVVWTPHLREDNECCLDERDGSKGVSERCAGRIVLPRAIECHQSDRRGLPVSGDCILPGAPAKRPAAENDECPPAASARRGVRRLTPCDTHTW